MNAIFENVLDLSQSINHCFRDLLQLDRKPEYREIQHSYLVKKTEKMRAGKSALVGLEEWVKR